MNVFKEVVRSIVGETGIMSVKRALYSRRGEPYRCGPHKLRYLPGTGLIRLSYLKSSDIVARNDARQIQFFLDNVKLGDTVLDIGGHHGQYAVLFSAIVGPTGCVVSFEPDPAAREVLIKNLALNNCASKTRVEHIALSDEIGQHEFFSLGGNAMSSLVSAGLGSNAHHPDVLTHTIATMRLDDYLVAHDLKPQWIKLDTEGAEINILRAAEKALRNGVVVLCELHPYAWQEFGTNFEELLKIVRDCGRNVRYLNEDLKIEDGPVYGAVIIS